MSEWAALVDRLIAAGHKDPLEYSLKQAIAFDKLAQERRRRELLEAYLIARVAAHADENMDKEFRRELLVEGR